MDFPRGPVVRSLPSNAAGTDSVPGLEAKISHALLPKNQNMKQKQDCKFSGLYLKTLKKKEFEIKLEIIYEIKLEINNKKDTWKIFKYLEIKSHVSN